MPEKLVLDFSIYKEAHMRTPTVNDEIQEYVVAIMQSIKNKWIFNEI